MILTIYGLGFLVDSFLRMRKGPWSAAFGPIQPNQLEIVIYQPALGINGVRITIQREAQETVVIPQGSV